MKFLPILILLSLVLTIGEIASIDKYAKNKRRLKILVNSPSIGFSHMQFQGKIADTLVEAGHEVHLMKYVANPLLGRINESTKAHKTIRIEKTPEKQREFLENLHNGMGNFARETFMGKHLNLLFDGSWEKMIHMLTETCLELFSHKEILEQLVAERYDVGISELYEGCPFGIFHRIGIPVKLASYAIPLTAHAGSFFGIPSFNSYMPNILATPSINGIHMTFADRITNMYTNYYEKRIHDSMMNKQQKILRQHFGWNFPILTDIMKNVSLIFVNSNEFFELPRPTSNKVKYIGGIVKTARPNKLNIEMQSILDKSTGGVILVSFGSVVDSKGMSDKMKGSFLEAFANFPTYDFIWKIDKTPEDAIFFEMAPNVHPVKWVNQPAILAHPKLRAFITHCGRNSVNEAADAGVPIVAIPLFGDQLFNAAVLKNRGAAEYVDIRWVEDQPKLLISALGKILNDSSYRQNALRLKKKLNLNPYSPTEKLVKWVEFAAEFPNLNELNLPSEEELGTFVYYSLDVILFALVMLAIAAILALVVFKKIVRFIRIKVSQRKVEEMIKKND